MPKLRIDNREVEVEAGATVLDGARRLGISIPTLCFGAGIEPCTSCMVCVVKVKGEDRLLPACATRAVDGMAVESETAQVREARKTALELLLSDHVGDCMGPCQCICPAGMNIPLMIRQIMRGDLAEAIATVKKDIALPAVLGRICSAPCEKGCRREAQDESVSICLLKRYVADVDLSGGKRYMPRCEADRGKRVAIVGAGPTGLSAAYYLRQYGYGCRVYDEHDAAGGALRYAVSEDRLDRAVLDGEIAAIEAVGVEFEFGVRVGTGVSVDELRKEFDAVLVAVGKVGDEAIGHLGLSSGGEGVKADRKTYATEVAGVFAAGDAVAARRMAGCGCAAGKGAAESIRQYLSGEAVTGTGSALNSRMGRLKEGEIERFMVGASDAGRVMLSGTGSGGFTAEEAIAEARRCLHCDCRKVDSCRLREWAAAYGAKPNRYKGERRLFEQQVQHREVVYEPGKCIDCGICIAIASGAGEALGLTFIGRGFDVRVAVPFGGSMAEGLVKVGRECAAACPTGALAPREEG